MKIDKQTIINLLNDPELDKKEIAEILNALPASEDEWVSVGIEPSIEKYYKLAFNDDVYLDVFRYRIKGIDGNSIAYFRSVNDNSTLDLSEVSHYAEFKTDAPDWTNLLPTPPTK